MCTAVTYQTNDFYFGRTLDYEHGFSEQVVVTPRNFPLHFRATSPLLHHHAIIGMACVTEGYPLYFDAVNEKGLSMAGLNFVGYAHYHGPVQGMDNIAVFEFIPWILGRCDSVRQAKKLLERINLTETPFSVSIPAAQLHWIIADREEAITVESLEDGLRIHQNSVGVLTNAPAFDDQLFHLNNYLHLSPGEPENLFAPQLDLKPYSRGMGALGLPGDLSSQSRFVRAAFTRLHSVSGSSENESVSQFFHILDSVSQTRGCCNLGDGRYEHTLYTACCNATKGIYYYTTYDNRQICAVDLRLENPDGCTISTFPLIRSCQPVIQNRKALKIPGCR